MIQPTFHQIAAAGNRMSRRHAHAARILVLGYLAALHLSGHAAHAQDVLPFPDPARPEAALTMEESAVGYFQVTRPEMLSGDPPNIAILMLDDVGPALSAAFGGPINTPTMQRIVDSGVAFSRFHTTAMCSPFRFNGEIGRVHIRYLPNPDANSGAEA